MIEINGIFSESFWYIAPILASITITITGAIKEKFGIMKGIWPQVVSWAIASLLSVAAWLFGFVQVGEPTWLSVVALCACVGLSSNGIYDIPIIKEFINRISPKKLKE